MKYMGSKSRIVKEILPIIMRDRGNRIFVEPFCGGCNVTEHATGHRLAADNNPYLIEMWRGLLSGISYPEHIDKGLYDIARDVYNGKLIGMPPGLVGWIGFMASFNGRFFDGGYSGHDVRGRDYIAEQIRNTKRQIPFLSDVYFVFSDFRNLLIPDNSLIYCDPPYRDTKQYSTSKGFDYEAFYDKCRSWRNEGHKVFISEYWMPDDFNCVWSKQVTNAMNTTRTYRPTEKLFTL